MQSELWMMSSPPPVLRPSIKKEDRMLSSATDSIDQITVLRRHGSPECNVVVTVRGRQMVLKCRHFKQAAKWAGIEAKSYKILNEFSVEWVAPNNSTPRQMGLERRIRSD
jgi:hypothetical protein